MKKKLAFLFFVISGKINMYLYEFFPKVYQTIFLRMQFKRIKINFDYYRDQNFFNEIPIINKKIFLEHFSELNTFKLSYDECLRRGLEQEETRIFRPEEEGYTIGLSSGTSGRRGVVFTTEMEQTKWVANLFTHLSWFSFFKKYRIAFFLRANSPMYEKVSRSNRINFKFFDLMIPLDKLSSDLISYNPSVIVAPSYILNELLKIKIKMKDESILQNVKIIVSVADVLESVLEVELRNTFKCPIHQIYQATEGFLATTCRYERLHLNEDLVYFEEDWIDKKTNRFSPILTDYFRETQAIVRYKLDDILVLDEQKCPCGTKRKAIKKIEGRLDEILEFGHVKIFPDYLRNIVQNNLEESIDFCIVKSRDLLTIKLGQQKNESIERAMKIKMETFLSSLELSKVKIIIEFNFERDLTTKRKRVFVENTN